MRRQEPVAGRDGFAARVEPDLAAILRRTAIDRGVQLWHIVEDALELGLPLLPPVGEALPPFAYNNTRQRGRQRVSVFVLIDTSVSDSVRDAAAARHAHMWWVVGEALRCGLPLLPPPRRAAALDYDEELPRSA